MSGLVVFTDALPGEELTARVNKVKKGYAEATKVTTLQNPLNLADPPCPHFSVCGGCNYQNLQYYAQLHAKQQQVSETLQRIGGISNCDDVLLSIIPCQQQYHYRNNMQFTFSEAPFQHKESSEYSSGSSTHTRPDPAKRVVIGLHKVNNPSEVVPIEACSLQHDSANTLLQAAAQALALSPTQPQQLSAFNAATQRGLLRQLILRRNSKNQYMVIFLTTSFQPALLEPLVTAVQSCNVEVLSIINTVIPPEGGMRPHRRKAPKLKSSSRQRPQSHVLFGLSTITERLCNLDFQISPESFFQVNSAQAEVLYDLVHIAAGLRPSDIVMDLFCGTGSIGLTLAKDCHHVYGFESAASSVADARHNAEVNGISNATFVHGDLTKVAAMMGKQYPNPDLIVTDPARAGMSSELIKFMQQSGARTIVYVSCNPATQARDIAQLCAGASARYRLKHVQPCDMFPNTAHIECVAVLERSDVSCKTGAHAQTLAK